MREKKTPKTYVFVFNNTNPLDAVQLILTKKKNTRKYSFHLLLLLPSTSSSCSSSSSSSSLFSSSFFSLLFFDPLLPPLPPPPPLLFLLLFLLVLRWQVEGDRWHFVYECLTEGRDPKWTKLSSRNSKSLYLLSSTRLNWTQQLHDRSQMEGGEEA